MIKDRDFLREVRSIAVPVTAQSVVMSLLLVTDQLMVGQLGTTAVATVGISSKLTGVLIVALTGLATGVSIFAAQHWGSGDRDRILNNENGCRLGVAGQRKQNIPESHRVLLTKASIRLASPPGAELI